MAKCLRCGAGNEWLEGDVPKKTREYPNGRLGPTDDGAVAIAVAQDIEAGVVRIEFAEPLKWTAMPPKLAFQFAAMIVQAARAVASGETDGAAGRERVP